MPVNSHEIVQYLKVPEGACFEFKEAKGGFHFEKLVEYVVALANTGGGKVILGVTDRRPRQIVGTQAFPEPGRTEAGLFDRLGHHVPIEECLHEGHRLLIVHVPARGPGSIWEDRGVAWSRAGDALVPLTNNQRFLIFLEAAPDFSAQLCPDATLADLDRSNDLPGPAQDRQEYREGFLLFHDALWNRINLRNDNQSYQDRFFRIDVPTFDEEVTREAILNAVCHREYHLEGSVFVRQYSRRLEIINPGGFPNGITVQNILDEQRPRNRRLADAFARCGLVERAGQGMDLIFERTIRHSKALPDFERSGPQTVFLTLQGTLTDEAFIRFVEKVSAHKRIKFDTRDLLVLDLVRRRKLVPTRLRSKLEHVAPSLSRRHLQRLLAELRATKQIDMRGSRRGSSWHPPTG